MAEGAATFDSVLVANRGEIAVRIFRTLDTLGIRSIAVFSDADADALHPARADVAVHIGATPAAESYLNVERILDAARRTGAQAIHPGYGFLSENAAFARACADAGVVFIGPTPEAMEAMGDKIRSKQTVESAGVPVVPGVHRAGMSDDDLTAAAVDIGLPIMVKATAGGGGKGMRIVRDMGGLAGALASARREARSAFGNDDLLLERYVATPRHIEVQVFADSHGNAVHLGERECSLQRRHQKVVEECPSPLLRPADRERMGAAAVDAAKSVDYLGAGTVEFIVSGERQADDDLEFFFMEMNTRLQVEHPVTEEVYGVDLVEWQLRVAAGEALPLPQEALAPQGHAVETRIYAEDPSRGFLPTGGKILGVWLPDGDGVRVDTGVSEGMEIGSAYDPMLAKVITSGEDRAAALGRMRRALGLTVLAGVTTNIGFLSRVLDDEDVRAGRLDTNLLERKIDAFTGAAVPDEVFAIAALLRLWEIAPPIGAQTDPFSVATGWRIGEPGWARWRMRAGERTAIVRARGWRHEAQIRVDDGDVLAASIDWDGASEALVRVGGVLHHVVARSDGDTAWLAAPDLGAWAVDEEDELTAARHAEHDAAGGTLLAPMPGTVTVVHVAAGDAVTAGQTLVVVEAMKMEHPVTTPIDGVVESVNVSAGQAVAMDAALAVVAAETPAAAESP